MNGQGATLTYDLAIRPLLVKAATIAKDYPSVAKYSKPFLEGPLPTEKPKKKLVRRHAALNIESGM